MGKLGDLVLLLKALSDKTT